MLNVVFSTTRQWNIGDEFILMGAINLVKAAFSQPINPIIYNRHPDLRTDVPAIDGLHEIKFYIPDEQSMMADANFRMCFRDNSMKKNLDGSFIDLVVFAGTPEWSNARCIDLYEIVEKYDLPMIALGVGNHVQSEYDTVLRNLCRFKLFTVRSDEFVEELQRVLSVKPQYMPCPALCGAAEDKIKSIAEVKHIGLIYSCDSLRSEINNCVSTPTYEYLISLFRELMEKHPEYDYSIVCHYIDEVPFAYADFPSVEVLYSYDAKDYYDHYSRFDMVIGARVHGIGCAASMGIPGVCVSHDFRGQTVKGFLAEMVSADRSLSASLAAVEDVIDTVAERNKRLIGHIAETKERYITLLRGVELPKKTHGDCKPELHPPVENVFDERPYLREALRELHQIPDPRIAELTAERDIALGQVAQQAEKLACQSEQITQQTEQLARQSEQIAQQTEQLARQSEQIAQQTEQLARQSKQITQQAEQLVCQSEQIAQLTEQLDTMLDSTCWKMTAPLRKTLDAIKGLGKGNKDK